MIDTSPNGHPPVQDADVHVQNTPHDEKMVSELKDSPRAYAEGRWRAWSTVFGAWLIQCCAVGIVSSYGVLQEFYTTTWLPDSSASAISWIGSIQIGLEYFMSPLGGELMDRGHFRAITFSGCALFVFSLFMSSFAGQEFYQIFLSQGIGMGLGVGLLFLPTAVVPIRHFREGHAFVIGLVDSSISVGGLAFSIGLNYLIQGSLGFHWGIRVAALITLACFILGCCLMRYPKTRFDEDQATVHPSWKGVLTRAQSDWPFLLAMFQGFIMSLGTFVPPFYVQLFAQMHGSSKTTSFYALAVLNFTGMFGRVIPNYFADRFGVLNIYIPCLTICGALCFAMLGATTPEGLFLFAVFYGFFFGATNGMYLPLVNEVSIRSGNVNHLWKRCGLSLIPPAIAALIGPPIAGRIVGPNYIWWHGMLFASLTMLAAMGLVVLSKYCILRTTEIKQDRTA